jgi:hypothetical protein
MDTIVLAILVILIIYMVYKHMTKKRRRTHAGAECMVGSSSNDFETRYIKAEATNYDDYSDFIKDVSLDPEIYKSHQSYTDDIDSSVSGSSMNAERSDDNDLVPFVGLRRPDYRGVPVGRDVRTETSEFVYNLPRQRTSSYLL